MQPSAGERRSEVILLAYLLLHLQSHHLSHSLPHSHHRNASRRSINGDMQPSAGGRRSEVILPAYLLLHLLSHHLSYSLPHSLPHSHHRHAKDRSINGDMQPSAGVRRSLLIYFYNHTLTLPLSSSLFPSLSSQRRKRQEHQRRHAALGWSKKELAYLLLQSHPHSLSLFLTLSLTLITETRTTGASTVTCSPRLE
jgi:hypothetical protein